MGRSSRVYEGGGAILQQLGYGKHRRSVFVIGGHRRLQPKHVGQVLGSEVIRKQTARRMGVADVHVTVHESGSENHPGSVNRSVSGD